MEFKWDEKKRESNILVHGIDFIDVEPLFENETVTMQDDRYDYQEIRFVTIGIINGVAITVVHTETITTIRIISARKATKNEEKEYYSKIRD